MSCNFKDFEKYYQENIFPKLKYSLETSISGKKTPEEIVGIISGNCLGSDVAVLSHYHKWLTENFDIKPKN